MVVEDTFAPQLEPEPPKDMIVDVASGFELFIGNPKSSFDASDIETVVDLGEAHFLQYDESTHILSLGANTTTDNDQGVYEVNIELKDVDAGINSTYDIRFTIMPKREEVWVFTNSTE